MKVENLPPRRLETPLAAEEWLEVVAEPVS